MGRGGWVTGSVEEFGSILGECDQSRGIEERNINTCKKGNWELVSRLGSIPNLPLSDPT